ADLSRWLAGEAVIARPLRPWERAARWSRRNPALAGLAITACLAFVVVSVALWFTVAARTRTQLALASEQRERQRATASEQERTVALVEAKSASQKAAEETAKAEAEK